MGILRTDRVSGLGGANAIKGSVFFPHDGTATTTSGVLQVQNENDALTFGTGDFTIEFWFYTNRIGVTQHLYDGRGTGAGSNAAVLIQISDSNNIRFFTTSNYRITGSTTLTANEWHHVALTRTGSTQTLYVNGSSDGTYSGSLTYTGPTNGFSAIGSDDNGAGAYGLNGYISNLRIAKELIYSAAFTVPTTELVPTSNTTLLCCQSPGDVEASFGGLNVNAFAASTNSKGPVASRFTPNSPVGFSTTTDVGTQFGSTFDGVTTFDSQAYFVPPGGNTRERNRGRAIFAGGSRSPSLDIQVLDISSGGIAQDFGDTASTVTENGSASSSTRMLVTNGYIAPASTNVISFITIANISSTTDFGDLTVARRRTQSLSNSTRGVHVAGSDTSPTPYLNVIDYNTIATAGNAADFGDTSVIVSHGGSVASSTRGVYSLAYPGPANSLEFITIATTGNGQDFGDLTYSKTYHFRGSICDPTRGLFAGGYTPVNNTINFITIATTGNATDFGDLSVARRSGGGTSNSIHSIFAGGYLPGVTNIIDRVVIQTTGNAADFGDLFFRTHENSGSSDSHGGLS